MSAPRGWLSPDRIERRDTARRAIRRLAVDRDLDEARLGRLCGYSRQRWHKVMTPGEVASPAIGDTLLLDDALGSHALLDVMVREVGSRMVPLIDAPAVPSDAMAIATGALRDLAQFAARAATMLPRGVTPADARALSAELDLVRRALGQLEAAVGAAVVEGPALRSSR